MVKRTPLFAFHKEHAKVVEFSGYEMPLWYSGISAEHMAVRNGCGIFDISHMGRVMVEGENSASFLDHLVPSNVLNLTVGKGLYTVLCNESGGIIDDIVVFRLGNYKYLVVVNASNLEKDLDWISVKNLRSAKISDVTTESAMLAVQGPNAVSVLRESLGLDVASMARFGISECDVDGTWCLISRSGYTGEDGFEIVVMSASSEDPKRALNIWNRIISEGSQDGLLPCGLGARDTLRLEAGLCLYGHDLSDSITPIEANLGWVVSREKGGYIGKPVIDDQLRNQPKISRVGVEMASEGIPRRGYLIYKGGKIGEITSGTFSPLLKKGIAMGYVHIDFAKADTEVEVDIRGQRASGRIVKPPFYDQTLYGWKRSRKN